jgi:mercuric ion transport protein
MSTFSPSHPPPVGSREEGQPNSPPMLSGHNLLVAGGILAALGAASCCVAPFALFILGVSGAWIGNLTALEPYQPVFVAAAAAAIGCGFYLAYRRPSAVCENDTYCASPRSRQLTKVGLWLAAGLMVIAIGFPKLAPLFL